MARVMPLQYSKGALREGIDYSILDSSGVRSIELSSTRRMRSG